MQLERLGGSARARVFLRFVLLDVELRKGDVACVCFHEHPLCVPDVFPDQVITEARTT